MKKDIKKIQEPYRVQWKILFYFVFIAIVLISPLGAVRAAASPEADFWKWFRKNETSLFDFERDQVRTFSRLAAEMHKVHPALTFEFGPKQDGKREFVISADGVRAAFPKVESLFSSAPSLPRWKIIKFRPRREPTDIQYEGVTVRADSVSVKLDNDGDKVALTVFIPGYTASSRNFYGAIAFLFLDQALGEFDVETRVGGIDVQASSASNLQAIPLGQLPKAFDTFFSKH